METYKAFFDIDMIKTVIRNLVNNAVKFSKEGGEVRISVLEKGDNLLVTIADNGVGKQGESRFIIRSWIVFLNERNKTGKRFRAWSDVM
ncbi:MAG: ATP-binding protein [Ignavibacteriae bacterium]|nr:ATP-binding protein [Ignavibacteriota bacterium]